MRHFYFRIRSNGLGQTVQSERLGFYTYQGQSKHGRKVYVRSQNGRRDQFLYYWDWGPNNGANWAIGLDPQLKARGIESASFENALYDSICVTSSQLIGPYKVI